MKIVLSRNALSNNHGQDKLFHLKGTCDISEMVFAEPTVERQFTTVERQKNQRLSGNSPEAAPAEKHSFRLIYQPGRDI